MAILAVDPSSSVVTATSGTSATSTVTIAPGDTWLLTANADIWYTQAAVSPVATAGSGSFFLKVGSPPMPIDGKAGAKIAFIQDSAAGKACIARAISK